MTQSEILANRLEAVLLNGTWIANTNYKDQLLTINCDIANTAIQNLNTIAILVQHIHYYIEGVSDVLNGGSLDIKDKFSFSFPPITSEKQWQTFLTTLWESSKQLVRLIAKLPDHKLETPFVTIKYGSYSKNINAMIEHCYYHLGQIVILKKMILKNS